MRRRSHCRFPSRFQISANYYWSLGASAMEADSQVQANMSGGDTTDEDERRASQLWDPKWEGSQEPSSHKASPGESGGSGSAAMATPEAYVTCSGADLTAPQQQPNVAHGLQLAVAASRDSVPTLTTFGDIPGDLAASSGKKQRTAGNCPGHLPSEVWKAGVDLNPWMGMHEMTVRWAPPEAWTTTSVFVHPSATAGDVKHFLQDLTKIKHTQCTLVGPDGQKIPYWVEVHACSEANPDPTEPKVLVPTMDRFSAFMCMQFIFASFVSVSGVGHPTVPSVQTIV